jgi:hypothetical protein
MEEVASLVTEDVEQIRKNLVEMDNIERDLDATGNLINGNYKPRVMVIVSESVAGEEANIHEGISVLETTIIEQFRRNGHFKVIEDTIERDKLFLAPEGDITLVANIGLQYEAEIVIMVKATASSSGNIRGTKIKSIHANMSAKAIRTDTAEIIATGSAHSVKPHIDETTGAHEAFQEAGAERADAMIGKILKNGGTKSTTSERLK